MSFGKALNKATLKGERLPEEFMRRFSGLDRAYGIFKINRGNTNKKIEGKAFTKKEPPTVELWENHLAGKQGIGIVPINDNNRCNFAAIDIDDFSVDLIALEKKIRKLNLPLLVCRSKSGGAHLYLFLRCPVAAKTVRHILANWISDLGFPSTTEIFPKQDSLSGAKDVGNWINMPYFNADKTTRYCIKNGKVIDAQEFLIYATYMAVTKGDLTKLIPANVAPTTTTKASKSQGVSTDGIPEGSRNNTLFRYACKLRHEGWDFDKAQEAVFEFSKQCIPQLSEKEVLQCLNGAWRYPAGYLSNDIGNANRLVDKFGMDLRYIHPAKNWIGWNGQRWVFDEDGGIMRIAKDTARSIYQEAAKEEDDQRRQAISKWANQCGSQQRLKSMVELAKSELPISPNTLDNNNWLLGCLNGVLDLKTGKLREPKREDFITKQARVNFDPSAKCPRWESFLNQIMAGNKDLMAFLQRACGYTLTGQTSEQCLFLMYGTGANGKSVFLQTTLSLLGDYAMQTNAETLMVNKYKTGGSASPDIARLRGARLVATSEVEDGQRLGEALVKQMTGGDVLVARFLYGDPFEFTPTFKMWLAANHKPIIRGDDYAIWRRIHLIPFKVTIPENKRDGELAEKMRDELPGILNWMIEGCMMWQQDGLMPPEEVKAATAEYKTEMDFVQQWINDCCVLGPKKNAGATVLYGNYKEWAEENIGWCHKQTMFGRKLTEKGFTKERTPRVVYRGIGIKPGGSYERF